MHDFNSLPDSPEELKRIILRLSENAERQKMQISHLERIIIDFRRDRFGRKSEKTDPKDFLKGYGGVVQTDGWTSYDTHLNKMEGVTHAACMAHIRREFTNTGSPIKFLRQEKFFSGYVHYTV